MKRRNVSLIRVCYFTEKAERLFEKIKVSLKDIQFISYERSENLEKWTEEAFAKSIPLLFICASGIVIRTIAPFVSDKFKDSPVIVMDEKGKFVIPLLSGHMGNANDIALMISSAMNCVPVITTATDVNLKFSPDNFAKKNGFRIVNRDGIKLVSSKILGEENITIWIQDGIIIKSNDIPDDIKLLTGESVPENVDVAVSLNELAEKEKPKCLLNIVPKKYSLGMGCKKNTCFENLRKFVDDIFNEKLGVCLENSVYEIASIDLKENEMGLMELAHCLHVPFATYSVEELEKAEGKFSESEFVRTVTGISNVCERSAVLSSGIDGSIVIEKQCRNGMTLSVAERKPAVVTWCM